MKPFSLAVLQHHPAEGPGEIANWAAKRNVALQIWRADLKELPPVSNAPLVLLGGPYSANAELPWLQRERAWLAQCLAAGAPVFAICLGAQLLTLAHGGRVEAMARAETGWCEITLPAGERLEVLAWHEDQCLPPAGTQILAHSQQCGQQMLCFSSKRIGLQFHPEWNAASVAELNTCFGMDSPLPREGAQDHARHASVARWLYRQLDAWYAQA